MQGSRRAWWVSITVRPLDAPCPTRVVDGLDINYAGFPSGKCAQVVSEAIGIGIVEKTFDLRVRALPDRDRT